MRLGLQGERSHLEEDPHGAAGVSGMELQQLLLGTLGAGREGAAVAHISGLTLERTHARTHRHRVCTLPISRVLRPLQPLPKRALMNAWNLGNTGHVCSLSAERPVCRATELKTRQR